MNFNPVVSGTYLSPAYKMTALEAIEAGEESFTYPDNDGTEVTYILQNKNGQYLIRRNQETKVIDKYASPSKVIAYHNLPPCYTYVLDGETGEGFGVFGVLVDIIEL